MANMTKALFQKKAQHIIDMGRKPELITDGKRLELRFVNKFDEVFWETVCVASTYDILNRQEKKYLAWLNEL
ncbi:hypothetical protein GuL6_126 [Buttiauxella phage vB_ButM_GuL6]|jgi:hypothetical protein|nr:hypothetical protein GuL6_126 [Buttiauxella phage vB_ButM_GuL6]